MTQPLTPQQIANAKQAATEAFESKKFVIKWRSGFVLQLIATLEARDAAFDAMLAALKPFARQLNQEKYISHPQWPDNQSFIDFDFKLGDLRAARTAIAQAEKMK